MMEPDSHMIRLPLSLAHWRHDDFNEVFVTELAGLTADQLPLYQLMALGSMISDEAPKFMINGSDEDSSTITVRTGVFFSSIIAGCSCADDPTPIDLNTEYGELAFTISKADAQTVISVVK